MSDNNIIIPTTMPTSKAGVSYYETLLHCGLAEGKLGGQSFPANVQSVIDALHVVLSGGSVSITIVSNGDAGDKQLMDDLLSKALEEANELNSSGSYQALVP